MDQSLFTIEALQNTWLKKEAVQADSLPGDRKVEVAPGRRYGVVARREIAADGHAEVDLAGGAGTWYLWEAHWRRLDQGPAAPGASVSAAAVNWSDFQALIHPYLTVGEVLQWDHRRRPVPGSSAERSLLATAAQHRLIREAWGSALGVTSFYRPEPINGQVGGVPGSRHITGEAMDLYPVGRSLDAFYPWIRQRWSGGLGDGRNKGFIHLDTRGGGGFVQAAGVRPSAEWLY